MKPELINGKMYQPVECDDYFDCDMCILNASCEDDQYCREPCVPVERHDSKNVYFINIEGE